MKKSKKDDKALTGSGRKSTLYGAKSGKKASIAKVRLKRKEEGYMNGRTGAGPVRTPYYTGNPNGSIPQRKKWLGYISKLHGYSQEDVRDTIEQFLAMTEDELALVINDPKASVMERSLARSFHVAMNAGDTYRIEHLLTRAHGSPKQVIETSKGKKRPVDLSKLPADLLKQVLEALKK